jgi:hypothetical protein
LQFGREVLLINGDTHLFFSDQPLANPNSATGKIHNTQAVPNLTRIVVQGSTNAPAEWLKLTIDGRKPYPFSWKNVVDIVTVTMEELRMDQGVEPHAAATASCQRAVASARKALSVDREMRWR